jgi:O-acetyl-ADP-ribose deacetylase (regulator of RNase III)
MITHVTGNLVKYPLDAFIHQANCFCTMGSGVAREVKETYPEVYEADCKTKKGDPAKMGTFSFAKTHDGKIGYNLYSQYDYGRDGKLRTVYSDIKKGLSNIRKHIQDNIKPNARVGIPCRMGCVRGGDWNEVLKLITETFENTDIEVVICELNEYSTEADDFLKKARAAYKKAELMGEDV